METAPIPDNPIAILLLQLLNDGWQIHLQDDDYSGHATGHAERIAEARQAAEDLCLQLAYFNQDQRCRWQDIPANEIAYLHQTVQPIVQQQLTQHLIALSPDNPWLFDLKGNPICAVPDWKKGEAIVSTAKQHGMVWQLLNRLECQAPTQFRAYERISYALSKKQIAWIKAIVIFCRLREMNCMHRKLYKPV